MSKTKIYIAGPYTKGDTMLNIRKAVGCAEKISRLGLHPFIPHLTGFWHFLHPHDYDFWMEQDEIWLKECDAVFRFNGESRGADKEIEIANEMGIPIFHSYNTLAEWAIKNVRNL